MAALNLSLDMNNPHCPAEAPVAITDADTGTVLSCHKTLMEAQKAKAMATGTDPITDPDLFARFSTPPSIAW